MEMKFTENTKLNNRVSQIINELKNEIVSRFHPKSIILTGSFGRGEATVIEENGRLKFLSDCEVIVIPYKWIFNRDKLSKFEQEFYEKHGLKVEIWGFTYTFYLLFPFLNKRIKPTIANYDLKYGSRVIYGVDYLQKIPNFIPEDIPVWEGIKLIFNRMAEALEYFSLENPTLEMVFWTDKIILACQDALLLTIGKYDSSYRKKYELFKKYFTKFQLNAPELLEIVEMSTKRKLHGRIDYIDPIEYWFSVSKICNKVFRYVIELEFGFTFTDYLDFQRKFIRYRRRNIFIKNFKKYLKILLLNKFKKPLSLKLNMDAYYTDLVYSIIPIAYFELCRATPDNKYLRKCLKILEYFGINCEIKDCIKEIVTVWRYVR